MNRSVASRASLDGRACFELYDVEENSNHMPIVQESWGFVSTSWTQI